MIAGDRNRVPRTENSQLSMDFQKVWAASNEPVRPLFQGAPHAGEVVEEDLLRRVQKRGKVSRWIPFQQGFSLRLYTPASWPKARGVGQRLSKGFTEMTKRSLGLQ